MNLLPNWQYAVIPPEKLTGYCLNPFHPKGKDKARVFRAVMGITTADAHKLEQLILDSLGINEAFIMDELEWGDIWRVDIRIFVDNEKYILRTNWIIRPFQNIPFLISCFIKV